MASACLLTRAGLQACVAALGFPMGAVDPNTGSSCLCSKHAHLEPLASNLVKFLFVCLLVVLMCYAVVNFFYKIWNCLLWKIHTNHLGWWECAV